MDPNQDHIHTSYVVFSSCVTFIFEIFWSDAIYVLDASVISISVALLLGNNFNVLELGGMLNSNVTLDVSLFL